MTATVITPFSRSQVIELGNRLWRKKLLPVGEVNYKGRMLHFTRDYIDRLAEAFHSRAYGQVPFQLAGDDNKHTNDVERFAGEIIDAEAGPDGLWVTLKATPRGEKVLTENPDLGVSARIVEDYERSDGKFFGAAIQHVLATLDPRIPELGPWQAIEASADLDHLVIDLSGYSFEGEAGDLLTGLNATPAEVSLLDEVLDELLAEESAIENWMDNGDPAIDSVLNAMLADPDDYGTPRLDDLSRVSAALEFSNQDAVADRASAHVARHLGKMAAARGDWPEAFGRYCEAGSSGHAVEMASRPGRDADAIELSRYVGDLPGICGTADEFGRCASVYHDPGCSHCFEAAASYAVSPADAEAWRGYLRERAGQPLADHHGQVAYDQHGQPMTAAAHFEALTGERQKEGVWLGDRSARRELISPQRRQVVGDPSADDPHGEPMPYGTRAAAAQIIAENPVLQTRRQSAVGRPFTAAENAAHARRLAHPDYSGETMRERAGRVKAQARQPVQLSQPMLAADGEDVFSAIGGSLGIGVGGGF